MDVINKVAMNVLRVLYKDLGASFIMAFLFMFMWLECKNNGVKDTVSKWFTELKNSTEFRIVFVFAFYLFMVLFRTLLGRQLWYNPVSNVLGIWGLHDKEGNLYTQNIENVVLFIPLLYLWLVINKERIGKRKSQIFLHGLWTSICSTLTIEFLQLFLKVGTIQITDIVFNITGGVLGTFLYIAVHRK